MSSNQVGLGSLNDPVYSPIVKYNAFLLMGIFPVLQWIQCFYNRMRYLFLGCYQQPDLFDALCDARQSYAQNEFGPSRPILADPNQAAMTYSVLIRDIIACALMHLGMGQSGERVGILLPNSVSAVRLIFAAFAVGKVPVMLQYATGMDGLTHQLRLTGVKQVYTAARFLKALKWSDLPQSLDKLGVKTILLDSHPNKPSGLTLLRAFFWSSCPRLYHAGCSKTADGQALLLFTSGSEGLPKAVVLSHANLLASQVQLNAAISFSPEDKVFHALPLFHVLGLCTATLVPLLSGIPVFLYPVALHYRRIVQMIKQQKSTILFGTDALLMGYAAAASKVDYNSLRYVFSGADALQKRTVDYYRSRFQLTIYEGYGATETSGPIAVNTPDHHLLGSVGQLLPGLNAQWHKVTGCRDAAHLFVSGPNVMLGYVDAKDPKKISSLVGGWYQTGDLAVIDQSGFIKLKGRLKRFIKVGGEMISLSSIESYALDLWPDHHHVAIARRHDQHKAFVLLFSSCATASKTAWRIYAQEKKIAPLYWPKRIHCVDQMPLLASGKVDFAALNRLCDDLNEGSS
jgi:acyl-[acyl-carrier-protein]-phospholipid O-acyltransferase / long-chain-fatty-acid--[acyl-carrier-protein] ligase